MIILFVQKTSALNFYGRRPASAYDNIGRCQARQITAPGRRL